LIAAQQGGYKQRSRDVGFWLAAERWQFCLDLDQSRDAHLRGKLYSALVLDRCPGLDVDTDRTSDAGLYGRGMGERFDGRLIDNGQIGGLLPPTS
jgi:hypothetical protein